MARVKTQSRPNPPPNYPLVHRNRATPTATTTTTTTRNSSAAAVKKPAHKSKVKVPKGLFKRHVEEVTRGVLADLRGEGEEEEDGGMTKWDKEALELLREVVEGFLEISSSGRRGR